MVDLGDLVTWEEFCKTYINVQIEDCGTLRNCSKLYNIDPSVLSKIKNGKYIPSRETMIKWFGKDDIPRVKTYVYW